jgi:hypothetical protein
LYYTYFNSPLFIVLSFSFFIVSQKYRFAVEKLRYKDIKASSKLQEATIEDLIYSTI